MNVLIKYSFANIALILITANYFEPLNKFFKLS